MKIVDHIARSKGTTQFTFEILPPVKGQHINAIFEGIDPLMEFNPPFIDVTYHREEYELKQLDNGLLEKRLTRRRPGTVGICAAIMNKYKVDAVPHVLCGGFTEEETENLLIDLDFLGIDNVVALRGDAVKNETYFTPTPGGHAYASQLVKQIDNLNKGVYLDADVAVASPTNFCIGVSGYPEKHMEAPSLDTDIQYLKEKVEAGADYIVTQMFFDNSKFFAFQEKCLAAGITAPIIPGLKPIATRRQLNLLPHRFHVDLPEDLIQAVMACNDNKAIKQVGIEWCIAQSKELKAAGVPFLHYYSMGKSENIKAIAEAVF